MMQPVAIPGWNAQALKGPFDSQDGVHGLSHLRNQHTHTYASCPLICSAEANSDFCTRLTHHVACRTPHTSREAPLSN